MSLDVALVVKADAAQAKAELAATSMAVKQVSEVSQATAAVVKTAAGAEATARQTAAVSARTEAVAVATAARQKTKEAATAAAAVVGAAQQEVAARATAATKVTAALKSEVEAQREANVAAGLAREKLAVLTPALAGVERGMAKGGGTARMLGQQLSQVAQQGAVTGNYLGALAVQLPDMALGFGSVAIAASIVATVAMPLIIGAFGGGKSAAEQATEANDAYGAALGALQSDMSAATDLQGRYAEAVRSGSATTVAALKSEAAIRKALLALDQNDLQKAQQEAAIKRAGMLADLAAAQQLLNDRTRLNATAVASGNTDEAERTNAELVIQQGKYDEMKAAVMRVGLEIDLNKAKLDGNAAAIAAATQALADMAAGVPPIATGLNSATGAANGLTGALAGALGVAQGIAAAVAGMNFGNIAIEAENAALRAGKTAAEAKNAGTIAGSTAQLAPMLSSGDGPIRAVGQNILSDQARELARQVALQAENQRLLALQTPKSGGGGGAAQTNEVQKYIASLKQELDVMRQSDPVQQEMLKQRDLLAKATDAQRVEIEKLVAAQTQEVNLGEAMQFFGQTSYDALSQMILQGKSAADVMKSLEKAILQAALQALVLGEGPLAGLFGTKGTSIFDIIGTAFGGKKAEGGMIWGQGGARDDRVMIAASPGEYVVNGRATAANRGLLEFINGGGRLPAFARGGAVGRNLAALGSSSPAAAVAIHIDARGAQLGVADQIAATLRDMAPRFGQMAVEAVMVARGRGVAV